MTGGTTSRAATDELLGVLRAGRWRPRAWTQFWTRAAQRSVQQAVQHPRALAEVTLLHAAFTVIGRRKRWVLISWALAASHLGMLQDHRSIGWANTISLIRANLPAVAACRWAALLAISSDVADGQLARALGTASPFGAAADSLADAAFWMWFAHRYESARHVHAAALLAWAAPIAAVTTASLRRGEMVDAPRPTVVRPAAALQTVLTIRVIVHAIRSDRSASRVAERRPAVTPTQRSLGGSVSAVTDPAAGLRLA